MFYVISCWVLNDQYQNKPSELNPQALSTNKLFRLLAAGSAEFRNGSVFGAVWCSWPWLSRLLVSCRVPPGLGV